MFLKSLNRCPIEFDFGVSILRTSNPSVCTQVTQYEASGAQLIFPIGGKLVIVWCKIKVEEELENKSLLGGRIFLLGDFELGQKAGNCFSLTGKRDLYKPVTGGSRNGNEGVVSPFQVSGLHHSYYF